MQDFFEFECGCKWPIIEKSSDPEILPKIDIDPENLPDCYLAWKMISRGDTKGVFQLESRLGQTWAKKLRPENMEHMAALGSLLRPGALQNKDENGVSTTEHYCLRKNKEEFASSVHEAIDPILGPTENLLVYQEQSMMLGKAVAGFDLKNVDRLRKCVTGDTKFVSKTRGIISIDTLLKTGYDDDFLVMDENGKQFWRKIVNIWSTGKQAVHDVETSTGNYVSATKYHSFLTSTGWKAKMRLTPKEDYMISCREIEFDGEDTISLSECMVIAGLITEGHFVDYRRAQFTNFDKFMMSTFNENFFKVFGENATPSKDENVVYLNKKQKDYLSTKVKMGLSDVKEFPEAMLGSTKKTMADFLSFTLGAEGGVSQSGQFEFSSKSRVMAHQVKLMLLRYGIRSNFCDRTIKGYEGKYYRLYVNNKNDQQKMLDELSHYWPEYKRKDLNDIINAKAEKNYTSDIIPPHIVKSFIDQYPWAGAKESGSLFKQPISRRRFKRITDKINDPIWNKFQEGKQCYELLEGLTNRRSSAQVYDFTMDGDEPYIVANGMVIHNCIGKKDMKEMSEVKKLFLEGAKLTNSVSYEMAEMLWSWIEKSGRYAFNKSHGVSYGAIGYDTAYLKIHFPLQFFTEWLRLSADKIEPDIEKMELIEEAKKFDIKVNPPKIEYKQYLFEHNGKEIFFGLTDIKGVGESNLEKLFKSIDEANIDIKKAKWVDWLYFIVPKNYSVMQKMIMAGCFDSFKIKRQRMLAEIAVVNELTDKEIKWMTTNAADVSFIEGLRLLSQEKPKGGCANVKRRAAVQSHADMLENPPSPQNDSIPWLVWAEVQTLGLAVTVSKVEAFTLEDVNTTCKDFQTGKTGMLIFGVEVKDFREVKTKKGKQAGKEMAFMSISDPSGTIDNIVCFPETWQNYKHLVIKGNTILLKGERDRENNGLIVQTISQLV